MNSLDAHKCWFTALEQTLHTMISDNPLLLFLLINPVASSISNWFKMQLQRLNLHHVPMITKVFEAIKSKGPWRPEKPPSFLSAFRFSSLATPVNPLFLEVTRVPSLMKYPSHFLRCHVVEHHFQPSVSGAQIFVGDFLEA